MEITDVKVYIRDEAKLKAYATIVIDNCFIVRDLKVIQGSNGLFIAMPSRKRPDGTYKDIAHPLNNETRQLIETKILDAYNKEKETRGSVPQETQPKEPNKSLDEDIEKSIESKFESQ